MRCYWCLLKWLYILISEYKEMRHTNFNITLTDWKRILVQSDIYYIDKIYVQFKQEYEYETSKKWPLHTSKPSLSSPSFTPQIPVLTPSAHCDSITSLIASFLWLKEMQFPVSNCISSVWLYFQALLFWALEWSHRTPLTLWTQGTAPPHLWDLQP